MGQPGVDQLPRNFHRGEVGREAVALGDGLNAAKTIRAQSSRSLSRISRSSTVIWFILLKPR
jgi:hypothetical protein